MESPNAQQKKNENPEDTDTLPNTGNTIESVTKISKANPKKYHAPKNKQMHQSISEAHEGRTNSSNGVHPKRKSENRSLSQPPATKQPAVDTLVAYRPDAVRISYQKLSEADQTGQRSGEGKVLTEEEQNRLLEEKLRPIKYTFMMKTELPETKEFADELDDMVLEYLDRPTYIHIPLNAMPRPKFYKLETSAETSSKSKDVNIRRKDCRGRDVRPLQSTTLSERERAMYQAMVDQFGVNPARQMPPRRRTARPWKVRDVPVQEDSVTTHDVTEPETVQEEAEEVSGSQLDQTE